MTTRTCVTRFLGTLTAVLLTSAAFAAPYVPPSLSPGDSYHLVFITDGTHDATSGVVTTYNNFVNAQAALNAPLTGTNVGVQYRAIVSTTAIDALSNAPVSAPVFNLNGDKIADNSADMWDGTIDNPIDYNQYVATIFPPDIWTGTQTNGQQFIGNELGTTNPRTGRADLANGTWISETTSGATLQSRIYALSPQLTVPVPEPASWALAALGACWLLLGVWRRQ